MLVVVLNICYLKATSNGPFLPKLKNVISTLCLIYSPLLNS